MISGSRALHDEFHAILTSDGMPGFPGTSARDFDPEAPQTPPGFDVMGATSGAEGIEMLRRSIEERQPFAVAFVNLAMPSGLGGVETVRWLWETSPDLQIVITVSKTDACWPATLAPLGRTERFVVLKKPFESVEVLQLAHSLAEKWRLARDMRLRLHELERRVAERTRELTTANDTLREQAALLNKAQESIIVWNLDGTVRFWNHSAERLYGRPAAEIIGQPVKTLFREAAAEFVEAERTTRKEGTWQGELPRVSLDGRTLSIEARWTLVRDGRGHPIAILAIHTDVTDKKELAARFIRTQRLESIGTLAGGIAHDLNNVLTPIVMGIEMLRMKYDDDGDADDIDTLDTIGKSAARGADMVRQVLSFARGAGGERRLLQPRYLIQDVQKIATETFPKDIHCVTSISRDLWNVQGDSTQLHQVLLNLAVNARDAMPAGGELTITAENVHLDEYYAALNPDAKPGPHVLIEVRDRGTGIPPELLERIFDPFFTTKTQGNGTGLGLSTSLGILKSHGGFFQVSSDVGLGTSFRVYLPADTDSLAPKSVESTEPVPSGHGEWILIVEDEAPVRSLTTRILEASGYRVLAASDGVEAIAIFARERLRIQAVIADLMMPIMDGGAMVQVLTRMDPSVRVIATSGRTASVERTPLARHLCEFLPKPYNAAMLLRAVAKTLQKDSGVERICRLN